MPGLLKRLVSRYTATPLGVTAFCRPPVQFWQPLPKGGNQDNAKGTNLTCKRANQGSQKEQIRLAEGENLTCKYWKSGLAVTM